MGSGTRPVQTLFKKKKKKIKFIARVDKFFRKLNAYSEICTKQLFFRDTSGNINIFYIFAQFETNITCRILGEHEQLSRKDVKEM